MIKNRVHKIRLKYSSAAVSLDYNAILASDHKDSLYAL